MSDAIRVMFRDMIKWERLCGRPLPTDGPKAPLDQMAILAHRLIEEEVLLELLPAIRQRDLVEIADGAIDAIWVILETLYFFGIDPAPIWDEVRKTNYAKFGPGSWKDETGKVMKPLGWMPPDIAAILAAQRPLAEIYGGAATTKLHLAHRGYTGTAGRNPETGRWHGTVKLGCDTVTFDGTGLETTRRAFCESVDDYLELCLDRGEEPEPPA